MLPRIRERRFYATNGHCMPFTFSTESAISRHANGTFIALTMAKPAATSYFYHLPFLPLAVILIASAHAFRELSGPASKGGSAVAPLARRLFEGAADDETFAPAPASARWPPLGFAFAGTRRRATAPMRFSWLRHAARHEFRLLFNLLHTKRRRSAEKFHRQASSGQTSLRALLLDGVMNIRKVTHRPSAEISFFAILIYASACQRDYTNALVRQNNARH